jgi:hypothetical protein
VAAQAMGSPAEGRFWDALLTLTPRTGIAVGAIVGVLAVLGFVGSAPGVIEAVSYYAQVGDLMPLP